MILRQYDEVRVREGVPLNSGETGVIQGIILRSGLWWYQVSFEAAPDNKFDYLEHELELVPEQG